MTAETMGGCKSDHSSSWGWFHYSSLIFLSVLVSCYYGIITRPVGFLADVWPANAIMLGLLIRFPAKARPMGWLAGGAAYMLADLSTGSSMDKALILNGTNIVSISGAYGVYVFFVKERFFLKEPESILYFILAAVSGGFCAGLVGAFANPYLFNASMAEGFGYWWITEFVNYVTFLPIILAFGGWGALSFHREQKGAVRAWEFLPVIALLVSGIVMITVGGPGAIAFPVPALLWCGLVYSPFVTAAFTLVFGICSLIFVVGGCIPNFHEISDTLSLVSIRLGVALIAVAPIMLSTVMTSRNELLAKLQHTVNHDPLTGSGSRHAFMTSAEAILVKQKTDFAVMMVDLDHFKSVNDTYGHAGGDQVLITFASRVRHCLRPMDLFGRLGGEEFAIMVPNCNLDEARTVAERIRRAMADTPISLNGGAEAVVTASIGVAVAQGGATADFEILLATADHALYQAKKNGRNRVEFSE